METFLSLMNTVMTKQFRQRQPAVVFVNKKKRLSKKQINEFFFSFRIFPPKWDSTFATVGWRRRRVENRPRCGRTVQVQGFLLPQPGVSRQSRPLLAAAGADSSMDGFL